MLEQGRRQSSLDLLSFLFDGSPDSALLIHPQRHRATKRGTSKAGPSPKQADKGRTDLSSQIALGCIEGCSW